MVVCRLRGLCCLSLMWVQIFSSGHFSAWGREVDFWDHKNAMWGAEIVRKYDQTGKVLHVPMLEAYIQALGQNIVSALPQDGTHAPVRFFLVDDPSINAFALPGGWIGVHTGLVVAAEDESELAAVLAHELVHVYQGHHDRGTRESRKNRWMVLASVVAAGLLAYVGQGESALAGAQAGLAASIQKGLNFSRELEQEADRMGLDLLKSAGFDPQAMPRFFTRLYQNQRFQDNKELSFLRTHPLSQERIDDSLSRLDTVGYGEPKPSQDFLLWKEVVRRITKQGPYAHGPFASDLWLALHGGSVDLTAWEGFDAGRWLVIFTQSPERWPVPLSSSESQTHYDRLLALGLKDEAEQVLRMSSKRWPNEAAWYDRQARHAADRGIPTSMHFFAGEAARLRGDVRYAADQYCAAIYQSRENDERMYWQQRAKARLRPWRFVDFGQDQVADKLRGCVKKVFPSVHG